MEKTHLYSQTISEFMNAAGIIITEFEADLPEFSHLDENLNLAFLTELKDVYLKAQQMGNHADFRIKISLKFTEFVTLEAKAVDELKILKYFVLKAFDGREDIQKDFAINRKRGNETLHQYVINQLTYAVQKFDIYHDKLIEAGCNPALVDTLKGLLTGLSACKTEFDSLKNQRAKNTVERTQILNVLYEKLNLINRAARIIYSNKPVMLKKYTLNSSSHRSEKNKEQKYGMFYGTIYCSTNEQPIENATITLTGTDFILTSDENGEFLFDALLFGSYVLEINFAGYKPYIFKFNIDSENQIDKEIYLIPEIKS
jgi:hypothetical protein